MRPILQPMLPALLLALPLPAAAFTAKNGMTAAQVGPTEIAVPFASGRADTSYWCAAGDFAERAMGLPGKTRMWRATPQPRKAGLGIVFTLDPAKQAEGAGISDFGAGPDDGSVSVSMAIASYCGLPFPFFRE